MAEATGRYVWFVDSDDWLPEGSLDAITAELERELERERAGRRAGRHPADRLHPRLPGRLHRAQPLAPPAHRLPAGRRRHPARAP
ncbi:hypothetical protein ACFSUJ_35045, partial [Streptomyces lusitanus]